MAPVKHNLLALGSAAVLSVYAAGYARTRAAAQQFENQAADRRPASEPRKNAVLAPDSQPGKSLAPSAPAISGVKDSVAPVPKRAKPRPRATDTIAKIVDSMPAPAPITPPPVTVVPAVAPPALPPSKDTVAKPTGAQPADSATTKPAPLKDGLYTGWGSSRHGDIQATVKIEGGRIIGAVISECLTNYSCSWIAALPGQVVARQSAEVDFVSGATQSTNAFYYAVVEALKKAK